MSENDTGLAIEAQIIYNLAARRNPNLTQEQVDHLYRQLVTGNVGEEKAYDPKYTAPQAADLLEVDQTTIRRWQKTEKINACCSSRPLRYLRSELERFATASKPHLLPFRKN